MSSDPSPVFLIVAILAMIAGGVAISVQAPINATLSRGLADPILAACISFFVGFVALLAAWGLSLTVRNAGPDLSSLGAMPAWVWIGGVLGTVYVLAALWSVPKIGVLTVVAAAVFGQLAAALVMDAVGAFGLAARDITPTRVLAVVMVLGGLVLSWL